MWRNYYSVTSVPEVIDLLERYGSSARIIAGGTDIILELERGARPGVDTLIDVSRVPGLDHISMSGSSITIGSLVTHNHVVGSGLVRKYGLPLAQACWEVGAPQIRNRATVAGNVITASPANDTITPLMALNARVTLVSKQGERTVELADFYPGYRTTVMRPDEFMTQITFDAIPQNQAGIFLKLALRRAQAISVLNVAAVLGFEGDRLSPITRAVITMGCVAPTIIHLASVEDFLQGKILTDETIYEAAKLAAHTPTPIDDVRGPASYRIEMTGVYVSRALRRIRDGKESENWPENPAMLWGEHKGIVQEALPAIVHHERDEAETMTTTVNGETYTVTGGVHKTLLHFLREDLNLTGTKEGCAEGECGACTVILDGMAVMACMVPAPRAHGAEIITVEGLAKDDGQLHPIQHGFVEAGAVQCGFCTPGFLVAGAKLLDDIPHPTREQIEQSISGNLCRCTGYYKILEAFELAQKDKGHG